MRGKRPFAGRFPFLLVFSPGFLYNKKDNAPRGEKGGRALHYIYAVMMLAAGLILIFSLSKENKVFYVAGGYFLFLGGWWLANGLLPEADLFAGGWGIAFKVITALVLVVLVAVFVKEYRKKGRDPGEKERPQGPKKD